MIQSEGAAQDIVFPVAQPFLYDLVAANVVASHLGRDIPPISHLVQVNVTSGLAQVFKGLLRGKALSLTTLQE